MLEFSTLVKAIGITENSNWVCKCEGGTSVNLECD